MDNYISEPMTSPTNGESVYQPNGNNMQQNPFIEDFYHQTSTIVLMVLGILSGQVIPVIFCLISLLKGIKYKETKKANDLTKAGWILYICRVVLIVIVFITFFVSAISAFMNTESFLSEKANGIQNSFEYHY